MNMNRIPLACALLIATASSAWAQTVPLSAEQSLRQEQERLRYEQERAKQPQLPSGVDLKAIQPAAPESATKGPCSNIKTVQLVGANEMYADEQGELVAPFSGQCLNAADIQRLMGEVTRHYIDRGFITTRAYLPEQDLRSGELRILVQEGRIEKIEVKGDEAGRINAAWALPAQEGDLLNIRDLEQAVDQINSAQGNKVTMDLVPGSKPGQTVVVFTNKASSPVGLQVSVDNTGSSSTGKNSVNATVVTGGLLGANETIGLTMRRTVPHSREKSADSVSLAVSLPLGYSTVGFNHAQSNYSTGFLVDYPSGAVQSYARGSSVTSGITFDRILARDQSSLHKAIFGLSTANSKNYFEQPQNNISQFLSSSSRRSTTVSAGINSVWLLPDALFTITPQLVMGVDDKSYLTGNTQSQREQPEFTKFTFDAYLQKGFKLGQHDMAWGSAFKAQYSPNRLLSMHQMIIGGQPSVRAYSDTSISGDSGYFWRNDISLKKTFDVAGESVKTRFYAGYDFGRVSSRSPGAIDGSLSGVVVGAAAQWNKFDLDISWTRSGSLPNGMERESGRTLLRLNIRY